MLLYKCFRFSEVMDQISHGPGCRVGFFKATLGVASVFISSLD